jgi:hypothetical protein
MQTKSNYITIGVSVDGILVSEIGLSRLEFEEIRSLNIEESLRKILQKDPQMKNDPQMASIIIRNIKAGNFKAREIKEGG